MFTLRDRLERLYHRLAERSNGVIARVRVEYSHSHESVLGSYACRIDAPRPGDVVESPLVVRGEARGTWYFEADFPVVLVDWDGLIIAEGAARAEQDWMTEDFVPFRAELSFESPYEKRDPDFMQRGTLILQRANPSGLPQNDAAVEVPLRYRE